MDEQFTVFCEYKKHLSSGFNYNFYWELASKASAISNAVR